jgi:hypothetical protein
MKVCVLQEIWNSQTKGRIAVTIKWLFLWDIPELLILQSKKTKREQHTHYFEKLNYGVSETLSVYFLVLQQT